MSKLKPFKGKRTYRKISCLVTNSGVREKDGVKPKEEDLGIIENAALVFDPRRGVEWVGPEKELPKKFKDKPYKQYNCKGLTGYPGFIDSHTHPAFGGNRAREFSMRTTGATYQEIYEMGGGINASVRMTRETPLKELTQLVRDRLDTAYGYGVRVMEAKSGYGLSEKDEVKSLKAIFQGAENHPMFVMTTCLAAHAVPPEYKGRKEEYVDLVIHKILPSVSEKKLAAFCDVFCDQGYFTVEETDRIFEAANKLGMNLRLHGDELVDTGAAKYAAEAGCFSVDHLLKVSDEGIRALAASETVATLLPATALFLKEPFAPARNLIDAGARVALATDFNPGSCTTQNLPLVATLAALHMEMTVAEIVTAITYNGAKSLGLEKYFGHLEPEALAEPVFSEGDHPAAIYYKLAPSSLPVPELM